jgi:hypothetical protein
MLGRTCTAEFKQGIALGGEAGERRAAVADEPKIERKLVCGWRGGAVDYGDTIPIVETWSFPIIGQFRCALRSWRSKEDSAIGVLSQ